MDLPVSYVVNGSQYISSSSHYENYIALFALPLSAYSFSASAQPQADLLAFKPWAKASNESVADFSAECYLVALGLFEGIYKQEGSSVPVGAIMSDWPGASITQLVAPAVLQACNSSSDLGYSGVSESFPGPIPGPGAPSSMWNAMIAPLTVGPLRVGNFIYHQGEADVHGWYDPAHFNNLTDERVYEWYSCRLRGAIADFRASLGATESSWFGVSQLNPYAGDCAGNNGCTHVAAIRAAQLDVSNSSVSVTAGVIPDMGDPTAPAGSVHSRRKQALAARLVAGALSSKYGASPQWPYYGPTYSFHTDISTPGSMTASVHFSPESLSSGGLQVVTGINGTSWCPTGVSSTAPTLQECGFYELLGSQSGWVNATMEVSGDGKSVTLTAPCVPGDKLLGTRAFWNAYPVVTLFSVVGLPAVPWNSAFLPK